MATVLLRGATPDTVDSVTPTVPTLSALTQQIIERRVLFPGEPMIVDPRTYKAAEDEMLQVQRTRGYLALSVANIPQRNFILFGVPIVCEDS
jgi:hypothetical protein